MNQPTLSLLFTLAALAAALVTVWLGIRFLTNLGKRRLPGQALRHRASMAVGSRTRLLAVSYRGREYLLGVGPERITVIDTFSDTDVEMSSGISSVTTPPDGIPPDGEPRKSAAGVDLAKRGGR